MTSGTRHTTFHRSTLIRRIAGQRPSTADYELGERLGQWLDFGDALALYGLIHGTATTSQPASAPANAHEPLQRLRRLLSAAIANDGVFDQEPGTVPPRHRLPTPLPGADAVSAADYTPYHRYYLAHQRDLSSQIAALRQRLRQQLTAMGGEAQRLAGLDAFFEETLSARERTLLGTVPMHLAEQFERHLAAHRASLPPGTVDEPSAWTANGSWLHAFARDIREWLLAELDLRLQPLAGLAAALASAAPSAAAPAS